jgi:hypothetical protein
MYRRLGWSEIRYAYRILVVKSLLKTKKKRGGQY